MQELVHNLGIDGHILIAQVVNFFILFLILRHYLYRPLLGLLDKRKETIETGLEEAQRAKESLAGAQEQEKAIIADAHKQANEILAAAHQREKEIIEEAVGKAREAAETIKQDARVQIEREQADAEQQARGKTADLIVAGVCKIIGEEVDAQMSERIITKITSETR